MKTWRWTVAPVLALTLTGCTCAQKNAPPPPAPPPSSTPPPAVAPAAQAGGEVVGPGLNVDAAHRASVPDLALVGGQPVVAWEENHALHVKQWSGSAWEALGGGPVAEARVTGVPRLAVDTASGLWVTWTHYDENDVMRVKVARLAGGKWATVGDMLGGKAHAQQAVVFPAAGQPLAVWREEDSLQGGFFDEPSAKWSASALGKTSAAAPAGASRGDGAVLAWLERVDGKMSAHCRAWDAKAKAWTPLPDLEGVDGDSTVSLESAPDGTVYATLTWNAGLRPIRTLAPGATAWTDVPLPGKPGGTLPSLAASEKAVAFSWVGEGGVHVARWTAGAWKELDARLSPGLATPAPVAIAPDGTLYAAWLDTGPRGEATAQLKVTRYRP